MTGTIAIPKAGSTLPNITTGASFPVCTTGPTCNKPLTTTDARGHVTDYEYEATGQLKTVTLPAPTTGAVRPQTRYTYATTHGVSMPVSVSACRSTAACANGADEVRTMITYPTSGSSPNRLLPETVTSGAGDGSLTATVGYTYTAAGDRASVDGPLPGTADISNFTYNANRESTLAVGPDPDGAGALKRRATKQTYNDDGQVTLAEQGTTDAAGANFAALQAIATTYDANARKTSDASVSGTTTYAVNQYSYDLLGRLDCTAQRMDPSAWGSPANACIPQLTGPYGPDRINRTTYDAASQVTKTTSAFGTTDPEDDATLTYTANGKLETLADGKNNLTTYEYDGFDRLFRQFYPSPTVPGTSNSADYEEVTLYDPNGNALTTRLRDNTSVTASFDNLNRRTQSVNGTAPTVTYSYDLLGRLLSAIDANGHKAIFTFDALGRVVSEESLYGGVKTMQYDLAGRRTRLTWPYGYAIGYERLVTGEVAGISDASGGLSNYGYDDLGRRTGISRANGTTTSYGHDGASRLTALVHDFAGTANDLTLGFTHNPAGQIVTRTANNDAYSFPVANQDATETPNGLNQLTQQGTTALTYDLRGNLTANGTTTFTYNSLNQLTGSNLMPSTSALYYEPLGRLSYLYSGSHPSHLFDYAGTELVGESGIPGTSARRYLPGPGQDEYLAWDDATGRHWPVQDERGSVIATANASGAVTSINRYDDYGVPASGNTGSLGYTGQVWLPEVGLNYYKARMYAPGLGRFMQTDPTGYRGGINLYAYVGGDPVNMIDPDGLATTIIVIGRRPTIPTAANYPGAIPNTASAASLLNIGVSRRPPPIPVPLRQISRTPTTQVAKPAVAKSRDYILDEDCSVGQLAGQWLGDKVGKLGAFGTNVGLGGTAIGLGTTAVGVGVGTTGNLPAGLAIGLVGLGITEKSAELTAISGLVTAGGATISALSGSGKPAIVEGLTHLSTRVIPSGVVKDFVSEVISKGL